MEVLFINYMEITDRGSKSCLAGFWTFHVAGDKKTKQNNNPTSLCVTSQQLSPSPPKGKGLFYPGWKFGLGLIWV